MADTRTIQKALGGAEDLLFGQGTVTQTRNGSSVVISKINASVIPFSGDSLTGTLVSIKDAIAGAYVEEFTADGVDATVILVNVPASKNHTTVHINGVYQHKSTYTIADNVITLGGIPDVGDAIEVMYS